MVYIGTCFDDIKNQNETGVDCDVCPPCNRCSLTTLPIRFDWRDYGVLPPVRDQVSCGSCWAFSAVSAVEGTYNIERKSPNAIDLSEQNLVSNCCPDISCWGEWPPSALNYIKSHGIVDEACFPYQSQSCDGCRDFCTCDGTCSNPYSCDLCPDWSNRLTKIGEYGKIGSNIDEIKRALICYGPLSVTSIGNMQSFWLATMTVKVFGL